MQPSEFDATLTCWSYYRDEAIASLPSIADHYDENSVIDTIRRHAVLLDHCWFNMYEGSRVIGFVAGHASECAWNRERIDANIAFIFVLESHRNMALFRELVTKFEQWARTIGAVAITAGDIGIDPVRTQALYEQLGFVPGVWMNKDLPHE